MLASEGYQLMPIQVKQSNFGHWLYFVSQRLIYFKTIQSAVDISKFDILISQSNHLFQGVWYLNIPTFTFHSFYLKLLLFQSKFSETRKFTLKYQ